jgi:RimJ/RimL family protein N-acetyltransferase
MPTDLLIKSDRLILRPIQVADSEALFKYRSDSGANRYQGWIPQTIADAHDFIVQKTSEEINITGTWFQLAVLLNESSELIGDIGIHFLESGTNEVELGCTLSKTHQGKGYATEALTETISYLFNELNKQQIFAYIDPLNQSSIVLFKRLDFSELNQLQENKAARPEWPDDLVFALRKEEWAKR